MMNNLFPMISSLRCKATVMAFSCLLCSISLMAQNVVLPKELVVAQDGSGNYTTIQEAVNSVRDLGRERVVIHIKQGIYHEKLVIPCGRPKSR